MKLYLSNSAFIRNIDAVLRKFDPSDPSRLEISTHDTWVSVHPVVLAMVAALGLKVGKNHVVCDEIHARSGGYLERMGLFDMLGIDSGIKVSRHDPSGRFIPLTIINTSDELSRFITEMIPLLHLEPKHSEPIRYIMSELVRNVLEHANATNGAIVAAQYHPKTNMIRVGIVDTGVGIKHTITQAHRAADDITAIKLALTPGITGTTRREGGTEFNAGAGLFFIKSIADAKRNYMMLYSGDAMYKLIQRRPTKRAPILRVDPERDAHSERTGLPYFDGTVVGVDISLDATTEFELLMALIRAAYSRAVRDRRKSRYKEARFI